MSQSNDNGQVRSSNSRGRAMVGGLKLDKVFDTKKKEERLVNLMAMDEKQTEYQVVDGAGDIDIDGDGNVSDGESKDIEDGDGDNYDVLSSKTPRNMSLSIYELETTGEAESENENVHCVCYCCELKQDRKSLVVAMQFICVLVLLSGYFMYKMVQLYDEKHANRNEHIKNKAVDAMPLPYVYFDFLTPKHETCSLYCGIWKGLEEEIHSWVSDNDTITLNSSSTIERILDATESDGSGVFITRKMGNWSQFWWIPPSDLYLAVGDKMTMRLILNCPTAYPYDFLFFESNAKDSLNQYNDGDDFLDATFLDSAFIYAFYETRFSYVWHTNKNTIDKKKNLEAGEKYDFMIFSGEANYYLADLSFYGFVNDSHLDYPAYVVFEPDAAGTKIVHVTEHKFDFLDVVSATGGIFASVNSFFALIAVVAIWGFEFGPCKFKGKFIFHLILLFVFLFFFFFVRLMLIVIHTIADELHVLQNNEKSKMKK